MTCWSVYNHTCVKTHSLICVGCRRDRSESANCVIWDFRLLAFLISIVFGGTEGQTLTSLFRIPVHPVSWPGQPQQGAADRWDQPGWDHYQCRQTKPHSSSLKPEAQLSRKMTGSSRNWRNDYFRGREIEWTNECFSCRWPCCVAVKAVIS